MVQVKTRTPPDAVDRPQAAVICRCGHCHVAVDVTVSRRRLRCESCGRANVVPGHVRVACDRCNHEQRVRFSSRAGHHLCLNCGHPLALREIELVPLKRHRQQRPRGRSSRRESVILTLFIYALALLAALFWFVR